MNICLNCLHVLLLFGELRIQPCSETQKKQLVAWCDLVLDYCRQQRVGVLSVEEAVASPLFQNKTINRKL